jgi:hypothetical protein
LWKFIYLFYSFAHICSGIETLGGIMTYQP